MADLTKEEIKNIIKQIKEDNELKKAFDTALGREEGGFKRYADPQENMDQLKIEQDRARVLKETAQAMNRISEFRKQESKEMQLQTELQLEALKNQQGREESEKAVLDSLIEQVQKGKELKDLTSLTGEISDSLKDVLEDIKKEYNEIVPAQEKLNKLSSEQKSNIEDTVDAMAGLVGLTNKLKSSKIGKMTAMFKSFKGEEGPENIKKFTESLSEMFSLQNIGINMFDAIFSQSMKTLKAFDDASANLAKTTGTAGKFNNVLYDAQRAGNLLGVTMEGVGSAIAALNAGTSEFAKLNEQTQTQLAISTSQFERLGVSAQDTAAFMENAFKIMNMGASEAIQVQKELAMAGVDLGIGADKIVKDFNAASKTLAVYGKDSVRIFKDLAAQAKAAGVEVSTLLGIVQKFDTFSGAAEGAAQFNALLGTQLSTTQMLMMTEEERMKTLVESVQAQGVAFGDMDRFTQKSIAAAAGISDLNEANRIFSMSLADYEANAAQMEQNAAAQAKFDEAVQATVPTMNKFKNLATELITLVQPALEVLGDVADYLTDMFQGMSKETKETISMIALFVGGIMTLVPLFTVGSGLMAGLAAVGPAIGAIGTGIATAISAVSAAIAGTAGIGGGVLAALLAGGAVIGTTMAALAESEAKVAESNAEMMSQGSDTIQAMREISSADFSGIAVKFKGVVDELNSMSTDVKVTSMMQNLSLISAGTAVDITGAKIAGSATSINTTVRNMFEGATISLKAGSREFEAYFEELAANVVVSNSK
jgi:hypothetical protein